jgi:hypothetical protein
MVVCGMLPYQRLIEKNREECEFLNTYLASPFQAYKSFLVQFQKSMSRPDMRGRPPVDIPPNGEEFSSL